MEGLCCLFVPLLQSFPLLVPFAVLYGYFDGAYVALIPVVTSDLVGTQYLSSALGVVYFLHAIPYLICPPIGGEPLTHNLDCAGVNRSKQMFQRVAVDTNPAHDFKDKYITWQTDHVARAARQPAQKQLKLKSHRIYSGSWIGWLFLLQTTPRMNSTRDL